MSQRSLFESGPEPSISSPAASPAPTSPLPEREPASPASSPDSGAKCSGLSAESRRLGSSLRTFLRFALGGRSRWSLIWRRAGIPSCRLSWWVLGRLELHTEETASGSSPSELWGTPRVTTNGGTGRDRGDNASRIEDQVHEWPTPMKSDGDSDRLQHYRGTTLSLLGAAGAFGQEWATPRASEAENKTTRATPSQTTGDRHTRRGEYLAVQAGEEWATPRTSDAERGRDGRRSPESQRQGGPCLAEQLAREWPTPAAAEYGSSNNGNPRDGRREVYATAGKPSLEGCAREEWPTPTARDWRSTAASSETHEKNARPLSEVVGLPEEESLNTPGSRRGSLNPEWVEALMGAPPGWTALPDETVSELWATRTRRTSRS